MTTGQSLTLIADKELQIERVLVAVENGELFVCKFEEFEAARLEGREPICIGFDPECVLGMKGGSV